MKRVVAAFGTEFGKMPWVAKSATPSGTKQPSLIAQLTQCLFVASVAVLSYLVITHYCLQTVQVVGRSMAPTLENARVYMLNRLVYVLHAPQPSDIVVLRDPDEQGFSVKRVIARAGDLVTIRSGKVFLNNQPLSEPYLPAGTPTYPYSQAHEQTFRLSQNEFFVLGDNRMNSADSRTYGPVTRDHILGRVVH